MLLLSRWLHDVILIAEFSKAKDHVFLGNRLARTAADCVRWGYLGEEVIEVLRNGLDFLAWRVKLYRLLPIIQVYVIIESVV